MLTYIVMDHKKTHLMPSRLIVGPLGRIQYPRHATKCFSVSTADLIDFCKSIFHSFSEYSRRNTKKYKDTLQKLLLKTIITITHVIVIKLQLQWFF